MLYIFYHSNISKQDTQFYKDRQYTYLFVSVFFFLNNE